MIVALSASDSWWMLMSNNGNHKIGDFHNGDKYMSLYK